MLQMACRVGLSCELIQKSWLNKGLSDAGDMMRPRQPVSASDEGVP
jgi:hypothetical protein